MPFGDTTSEELERIATEVVDSIFKIHKKFGPGLLESVYEVCLSHELKSRGLNVRKQVWIPIVYEGVRLDAGLRIDLLVEESIIIEVKAVEALHPIHKAQVLTYLKMTNLRLAFLVNFNVEVISDGIRRVIL
jgi:GxxExxY protein